MEFLRGLAHKEQDIEEIVEKVLAKSENDKDYLKVDEIIAFVDKYSVISPEEQ